MSVPLFLILASLFLSNINLNSSPVLAQEKSQLEVLSAPQPIKTTSRFITKTETDTQILPRPISYKDDPDKEIGTEDTLEEGSDGQRVSVVKIYFDGPVEYSREILSTETTPTREKIISRGTKIIWRDLSTPEGSVSYWRKIRAWATSYDSHCLGCDETTATGLRAGKGVIAVDPSVIKLGSRVYIPGYGVAIAGDTGGAIKGSVVDLGFDNTSTAGWSARFVDVYLIN